MEALIAVASLVLLAILAARFGHDSRPTLRTKEQDLGARGMTWRDESGSANRRTDRFERGRDVVSGTRTATNDYPVLTLIDRALGPAGPAFAMAADAARLERRAQELADAYWGETVWLTGRVPEAALRVVRDLLDRERTATEASIRSAGMIAPADQASVTASVPVWRRVGDQREVGTQPLPALPTVSSLPPGAVPA